MCATVGTVELIKSFNPDFLINTGVAGTLTSELSIGDMVVVDCNGMDYICSSGLRYFLKLYHETAAKACKMVIKGLHPLVKGVFDMSGFSHIFNIEE